METSGKPSSSYTPVPEPDRWHVPQPTLGHLALGNLIQSVFPSPLFLLSGIALPHFACNLAPILHIQVTSEGNFAETLPQGQGPCFLL